MSNRYSVGRKVWENACFGKNRKLTCAIIIMTKYQNFTKKPLTHKLSTIVSKDLTMFFYQSYSLNVYFNI